MARTITSAVVGAIFGTLAAAIALHSGNRAGREAVTAVDSSTIHAAPSAETSVLAPVAVPQVEAGLEERLARLAALTSPAERRAAALALVEVSGADREVIDRIAVALPQADRLNFTFDALAAIASRDPDAAIRLALDLGDRAASSEGLARIGRGLAHGDARSALARARSIGNYALHDAYVSSILEELAGADANEFFAVLASDGAGAFPFTDKAFERAAAIDAERLLALSDSVPARARVAAVRAALESFARTDVVPALEYVERQPPGPNRDGLLGIVARAFAQHDPEAAVTWMNALPGRPSRAVAGVLSVIAETQPVRAVDLLIANLPPSGTIDNGPLDLELVISSFTPGPRESLSVVADRLSDEGASTLPAAFNSFIGYWSRNDLDAAYEWARSHADRLTPDALAELASNTGGRRDLAEQAVSWLPADQHRAWVLSVARGLAENDLDDTLEWLAQFRDRPFYGDASRFALEALSTSRDLTDALTAARFLDSQPSGVHAADAMAIVARAWARHDPEAAARWVGESMAAVGEASRASVIGMIASVWAQRDYDAARVWALRRDSGEQRNGALTGVLTVGAAAGRVDTQVLAGFGSEQERQQALARALPRLGATDPPEARRLIAQYLTDPTLRAQAEATLTRGLSLPPGFLMGF